MIWVATAFQWVINATISSSIVALCILILKFLFKEKLGVRWSYCVWFILIIKLVLPYSPQSPISMFNLFTLYGNNISESKNSSENTILKSISFSGENTGSINLQKNNPEKAYANNTVSTTNTKPSVSSYKISIYEKYLPGLACILWLTGILILSIITIFKIYRFNHMVKQQTECSDKEILNLLIKCQEKMNIKKDISIIYTDLVKTPAVMGSIQPKLLLPSGIEKYVSTEELEYIFLHEMAHLKRKDITVSCITCVLQILHWFNPIIWYSFYKMRQDRELACDSLALSYINTDDCIKYGNTILKLLENYKKSSAIYGMAGIINNKSLIKRRIKMISLFKKNSYRWTAIPIIILLIMGGIMLTNSKTNTDEGNAQKVAKEFGQELYTVDSEKINNYNDLLKIDNIKTMAETMQVNDKALKSLMTDDGYETLIANRQNTLFTQLCIKGNYTMQVTDLTLSQNAYDIKENKASYNFTVKLKLISEKDKTEQTDEAQGYISLVKENGQWKVFAYKTTVLPKQTEENSSNIDLSKLNITMPKGLSKKVNENEVFFYDQNKQTVGGISLIGYYGDYIIPNHSEIINTVDIDTSLGKGKLFSLKRSNPAADNPKTWDEVHAIIPANKDNLAYDIWIKGTKDTLLSILKSIK